MKLLVSSIVAVLASATLLPTAQAQTNWYLHGNQASPNHWSTLTSWFSQPYGAGSNPAAISSSDIFHVNGMVLRTPDTTASSVFGGALLTLDGGTLAVKCNSSTSTTTIGNLTANGGIVSNFSGGTQLVNVTNFNVTAPTEISASSTRGMNLTVGTLTGNGNLNFAGGGNMLLGVTSASQFLGNINVDAASTLTVKSSLTYGGALVIGRTAHVVLNGTVSCAGLFIDGTQQPDGTYSAAALATAYPAIFTGGSGSIVVRTPGELSLHASQGLSTNWSNPASWFTDPTGGTNPASLNPADDFFTNGFQLRSPDSSTPATFPGATLTLNGGGLLVKAKGTAPAITVRNLLSTGGTMTNGTGAVQVVNVDTLTNDSGTLNLDVSSNTRGLNLKAERVVGSGATTFLGRGGGTLQLSIADAYNYTGALTLSGSSTGTFTFGSALFSGGSFVVGTGNSVVLNQAVRFSGLTIGGTSYAPGTYTASALGFSGAGSLTVMPRPDLMFGTNFSGAQDSSGVHFPKAADYAYYASKGQTLVRLPFKWERIQPVLNGPLDATHLAGLDNQVTLARNNGMKVILDVHNFGRFGGQVVGTTAVPNSAFADLWIKLATHFASESAIYAYDVMNEPHDMGGTWPGAAQAVTDAIRTVDTTHFVMIEGESYSSARTWPSSNKNLDVVDPANRLIYSAHCYFANANNDQYDTYDAEGAYPDRGAVLVAPFVNWLKTKKAWGHVGEYGVPKDDARWNVVLDHFLRYLDDNGVSGNYWAGPGFNPASYPLGVQPTLGVDAPQMSVLEQYGQ